jgi:hypothetical protein
MQAAIDLAKELKAQKLKEGWLIQKCKYWRSCRYKSTNTDTPPLCPENQARLAAATNVQILTQLSFWYKSTNTDAPPLCPENQARLAASQAAKEVAEAQRKAAEAAREREKRKEEVYLC